VPLVSAVPKLPASPRAPWDRWREEFLSPLSNEWLALRTPGAAPQWAVRGGMLEVTAGSAAPGSMGRPAFTGRRLRHHKAEFTTRFAFAPERRGDFAGLLAFMDETHFLAAGKEAGRIVVRLRSAASDGAGGTEVAALPLATEGPVELKLAFDGGTAAVFVREEGTAAWRPVGSAINVEPLASVHAGLFTGLVVGPYAHAPG
jgi:alpha-N-arabinofuranosidase